MRFRDAGCILHRTDPEGGLPTEGEQQAAIVAYAAERGSRARRHYEDLEARGILLYHRPGLKDAINNIKELEEWEVLVVAQPRCVSDTDSALHEFVHKFSLYGNRLESPARPWEESPRRYEGLPARDEPALSAGPRS